MNRPVEHLEDGSRIVVRDEATHTVHRSVNLAAGDPDYPGCGPPLEDIDVVVSSVESYDGNNREPRIGMGRLAYGMSRKQWELVKRLGDRAWSEYERRFVSRPKPAAAPELRRTDRCLVCCALDSGSGHLPRDVAEEGLSRDVLSAYIAGLTDEGVSLRDRFCEPHEAQFQKQVNEGRT